MIITFIYFKFDFYLFLLLRITFAFYVEKFEKNMIFKKKNKLNKQLHWICWNVFFLQCIADDCNSLLDGWVHEMHSFYITVGYIECR